MKRGGLTDRERLFVAEYLVDLNATQAATRAGFSGHRPDVYAVRLMKKPAVLIAIKRGMERREQRTNITADRVLREYEKIAFANAGDFMDWDETRVTLVPRSELTDDDCAAISEIAETKAGRRVKLHDKLGALDSIARHLGMFNDKLQLGADKSLLDVLNAIDGKTRGIPRKQGQ